MDYMHGVLLGVQNLLLKLLFNNSYSKKVFRLYNMVSVVDERLKNIFPTLDIKRLPRSISEHLKYWEVNELCSFLLYYGLPVLYGLLPDKYFEHYFYFVRAIYLLLLESICDLPQDFNAKGESTRTTRFHFKTKEFILARLQSCLISNFFCFRGHA